MNGQPTKLYQSDCPLSVCRWTSDPLSGIEAAREARRKHISEHPHGELVEHIALTSGSVAEYERAGGMSE